MTILQKSRHTLKVLIHKTKGEKELGISGATQELTNQLYTVEELQKILRNLAKNVATGLDKMPRKFF